MCEWKENKKKKKLQISPLTWRLLSICILCWRSSSRFCSWNCCQSFCCSISCSRWSYKFYTEEREVWQRVSLSCQIIAVKSERKAKNTLIVGHQTPLNHSRQVHTLVYGGCWIKESQSQAHFYSSEQRSTNQSELMLYFYNCVSSSLSIFFLFWPARSISRCFNIKKSCREYLNHFACENATWIDSEIRVRLWRGWLRRREN